MNNTDEMEVKKEKMRRDGRYCNCGGTIFMRHCDNCGRYWGKSNKAHKMKIVRSPSNYYMPACEDCKFCQPNRGHFGCVITPIVNLQKLKKQ